FNRIKNKEVGVGGIIAAANHRISRNGKPCGSFIIEDYSESFESMVCGEDYVKCRGYLQEGCFVQIRGLVQERFRQAGNWSYELVNMQMRTELQDIMIKTSTIN